MNSLNQCYLGDCRDSMRRMLEEGRAGTVQCIVTSPPYWGLRDYGVAGQLGQEPTLREFLENMVEVFDLCRELLAPDGTCWVNMGDSYARRGGTTDNTEDKRSRSLAHLRTVQGRCTIPPAGLKEKDLVGQPWRLAFALQDAGWYLRQDIIWHKPNPMPESVRDRCTKAHEYLFLLAKSERYYFNADAIKEPAVSGFEERGVGFGHGTDAPERERVRVTVPAGWATEGKKTASDWATEKRQGRSARDSFKRHAKEDQVPGQSALQHRADRHEDTWDTTKRNKRSVWTIATESYSDAHFATFPRALVEPCILAGSRPGDTVFDPFLGSGTVAEVAQNLGRNWLGCELNPEYVKLQHKRTQQLGLMLGAA